MTLPMSYDDVIARKSQRITFGGIEADDIAPHLFPYQADLVRWALRKGRAAIFADTGLGKTAMQIEWARQVSRHGRVLILAPLAVADQTHREAGRFGVSVDRARSKDTGAPIVITNYEQIHHFNAADFVGIVLDESSILKSYDGKTRNAIIGAFAGTPYRLACTATPAPNDFTELGNHSEFLGVRSRVEMLAEYFVHDGGSTKDWRLKGHAVAPFWLWVSSWGALVKTPADLGYDDDRFDLPPLVMRSHVLPMDHTEAWSDGALFLADARSLNDQRRVRKATMSRRVQRIVDLIAADPDEPWLIWCEYNAEGEALTRAIADAVQVQGSDTADHKRDSLLAFADRDIQILVTKAKIAGFGMNWQHCARMAFVGPSHSYEQVYQAIRRCWRFGQTRPVEVHIVCAETERAIVENYARKEANAALLAEELSTLVGPAMRAEMQGHGARWNPHNADTSAKWPQWLHSQNEDGTPWAM